MKYKLDVKNLIAGISMNGAEEGEMINVLQRGFLHSGSGELYYRALEQFEDCFLAEFNKPQNNVSQIDHYLVLIHCDRSVEVYINEFTLMFQMITSRALKKGEKVRKEDVAGITKFRFKDFEIPNDVGIVFYFNVGWRSGVYFDLTPLHSSRKLDNILKTLGDAYQSLLFNKLFINEIDFSEDLLEEGWFPFVMITGGLYESLLDCLDSKISIKNAEEKVLNHIDTERLMNVVAKLDKISLFRKHNPFIKVGIERYIEEDYLSAISNIWPRIEGILRGLFKGSNRPGQQKLTNNLRDIIAGSGLAPITYFPDLFRKYLLDYYFRDFDTERKEIELSRHSHSHGVADVNSYDKKRALIGILIIDQLSYYVSLMDKESFS